MPICKACVCILRPCMCIFNHSRACRVTEHSIRKVLIVKLISIKKKKKKAKPNSPFLLFVLILHCWIIIPFVRINLLERWHLLVGFISYLHYVKVLLIASLTHWEMNSLNYIFMELQEIGPLVASTFCFYEIHSKW